MIKLRFWVPAILWMALIFIMSTDLMSSSNTSRLLAPLLHWLFPGITDSTVHEVQFWIRKAGHFLEYAILAMLIGWAVIRSMSCEGDAVDMEDPFQVAFSIPQTLACWGIAVLFAVSDEFHQSFYASRQAAVMDVVIDVAGALSGALIFWWRSTRGRN